MAGNKYFELGSNNRPKQKAATQTSAGGANANEIVALDAAGLLDSTLFPPGVGPDAKSITAGENITAPAMVNIYDDAGTLKARRADYSNGREVIGYIKDNATSGAAVTVYFDGISTGHSALTIGANYYISTLGTVTTTPATSGASCILQKIGKGYSATEIVFEAEEPLDLIA